jgi:hypothetical protein
MYMKVMNFQIWKIKIEIIFLICQLQSQSI